jgi:L,D-peptidoglycan transpeptidase YkuD (ErfK/YbiS/YcfS/YnhG family)
MKIRILLSVSITILILVIIATIRVKRNKSPEAEVMKAGKELAKAQYENSPKFAKELFIEADFYYNDAMSEWKKQNERFILFRDYGLVSELAQKSIESSEKAIIKTRRFVNNTEDLIEIRIEEIGEKIKNFEEYFGKFPVSKDHRDEINRSKLLYSESIQAYKNKNYSSCTAKLDSVETVINKILTRYQDKLEKYFEDYPKWDKMLKQTISWSEKNQTYVLIVDKFSRELSVYKNGKIIKQYTIELGANWVGDKIQQGDKSTPEGMYKVIEKKQNGQTKYHKAILLDYPNEEDRKRFALNKKNGIINHDAKIGNLIEIHGSGGKGIDWTDGCIALTDTNMDEIYKFCNVGTRITIVGSIKPLYGLSITLK